MTHAPFVVLGRLAHHPSHHPARLHFPYAAAPVVCPPDEVWPDEVRLRSLTVRGVKKLRGSSRLAKLTLLEPGGGEHWVVRREAADAIAALGRPGDVRLVPAPLVDEEGYLDGDWALLDVRASFPLDRSAATFTPSTAGAPHASLIARVDEAVWSLERAPEAPLFRVAEAPELLVARDDVAARIAKLLGRGVVPIAPPYDRPTHAGAPCARLSGVGGLHRAAPGEAPPMPIDETTGRAAFDALDRLLAGRSQAGDRAAACASPITAYHLARLLDRAAGDDTRAAALQHPRYATLYARDIDRGPRDDTRRAACAERFSAHAYFRSVERAPHPELAAVLGPDSVATLLRESASVRAAAQPPPERFPPDWSLPRAAASSAPPAKARRTKP